MGLRGADPFVEQVRLASDILAVIGSYMELKKAGRRWKGLCPFHGEKTASFFVNPETQSYYCFGCQQGGDVFTFLMEMEKMTFPETLRSLAERAGIPMPKRRERGEGASTEERLGEAMEVAAGFYRERLAADDGAQARRYLQARGLGPETIERFGLGWAPAGWDSLLRHARRLLPERILILAGLAIEGTRGPYDRFRERVIVPIRTAGGRPVAFGGRTLGAEEPKYINSPETPLYRKGTVLFGLGEARDAIRRAGNVLVVEGYFDVIALSAAGIGEVVGTCGTALTPDQAGLLRRYSDRWTLLFDGDAAGRAAVLRALDAAVPVHPGVRIALCPTGKDPDDWVRSEGAQSVREALDRAQSPLQYLEEWAAETGLPAEEALGRVAALLARVRDPLVRDLWIQEAAGRFRVREQRLAEAIAAAARAAEPRGPAATRPAPATPPRGAPEARLTAYEREVVSAAVRAPRTAARILEASQGVPAISPACSRLLAWIEERYEEGVIDAAGLLSRASDEPGLLRALAFLHEETGQPEEIPTDLVRRLREQGLRQKMRDLTDRIRRMQDRGEDVADLLRAKQELATELRDLPAIEGGAKGNFL